MILLIVVVASVLADWVGVFPTIMKFQDRNGGWSIDDFIVVCAVLAFALPVYGWRRFREVTKEIRARREAETEVSKKVEQLTQTQNFLNTVVENVPATIFVKQLPDYRYVLVNRQGERFLGLSRDRLLGKTAADVYPASLARIIEEHDRMVAQSGQPITFDELPMVTPANGTRTAVATGVVVPGEGGKPGFLVNLVQDVTEIKCAKARIEHLARHDPLTDLPNRAAFNEHLKSTAERAAGSADGFALLCVDLERFKEVNDVFGHAIGDDLLREIARRLQTAGAGAFVARLGGDEFGIICTQGPQPAAAEALAERLLNAIDGDIKLGGQALRPGMTIGVAVYPTDGRDIETLVANADAALYRAKEEARGSVRFFEPEMDRRLRERRALQHDLRSAIAGNEIVLHYQPQASIDGIIVGFEALARWKHPGRGMISPGEFIPLAEETGLIVPLGEAILREACREAATWPKPLQISVNFSPVQFRRGNLPALVHSVLLETGLAAKRLEIEITEGVLISDFAHCVPILRRLKALGVGIAMDDFGTGYSSLSYLQAFPFDKIKIDQAFVANLDRNPQSRAIIRAVIGLGHGLDLPVIAEGVETREQLKFLAQEKCNQVQGYLIGRPAPIHQYAEFVGRKSVRAAAAG